MPESPRYAIHLFAAAIAADRATARVYSVSHSTELSPLPDAARVLAGARMPAQYALATVPA